MVYNESLSSRILIVADHFTIDGFTITGGNANGDLDDNSGGEILILLSAPSIVNGEITEKSSGFGGG